MAVETLSGSIVFDGNVPSLGIEYNVQSVKGAILLDGQSPTPTVNDTIDDCPRPWSRLGDSYTN